MAIDLATERIVNTTEATQFYPDFRPGQGSHPSRVVRHMKKGLKRPGDGAIVRLEYLRLGGQLVTSVEAIQRFAEALTIEPKRDPDAEPATSGGPSPAAPLHGRATIARREREVAAAAAGCDVVFGPR